MFLIIGMILFYFEQMTRKDIYNATDHDYGPFIILIRRWIGTHVDQGLCTIIYLVTFIGSVMPMMKNFQEPK